MDKSYDKDKKHWTNEEFSNLKQELKVGFTDKEIAHGHERRIQAIKRKKEEIFSQLLKEEGVHFQNILQQKDISKEWEELYSTTYNEALAQFYLLRLFQKAMFNKIYEFAMSNIDLVLKLGGTEEESGKSVSFWEECVAIHKDINKNNYKDEISSYVTEMRQLEASIDPEGAEEMRRGR